MSRRERETELQVARARMKLLLAAHGPTIEALASETGISQGTMMHVVAVVLEVEPPTACAQTVLRLWDAWAKSLGQGDDYENFAVYVRRRLKNNG